MSAIQLPATFYFKTGAKAVLLLHAYTGSPNDMRMLARALESQGYSVYAPMFTGHGTLQPQDILTANPELWWQDTQKAIQFLRMEGFQKIAVFGLSMGGIFTMKAMEEYGAYILGGGTICSPVVPEREHHILPNFLNYCETVLGYAKIGKQEIKEKIKEIEPKIKEQLTEIEACSAEVAVSLEKVKQPVFLAQAGKDEMIDPESVYLLKERLVNTIGEIHWYSESTHVMTVGKNHKQLEQDILTFLNTLSWNEEKE